MKLKFLQTGQISGTHGIRGEVRIHPWSDSPEILSSFKTLYLNEGKEKIKVNSRPHGNMVIAKIDGVDTIEQAERYRGKILYLNRDDLDLPDDTWFIEELIGCKVYDADSKKLLGEICDVSKTGANDVWHIKANGKEYLVPVIDDVVINVDIDAGQIVIRPLKGIFDDEN
jgi:16S rRNA processing protein RimM